MQVSDCVVVLVHDVPFRASRQLDVCHVSDLSSACCQTIELVTTSNVPDVGVILRRKTWAALEANKSHG